MVKSVSCPTGGRHRAGHALVVEGPQLLDRPAAPADDDDIRRPGVVEKLQRLNELRRRPFPLHQHRGEYDDGQRITPSEHVEDIPYRRAGWRGNHPDFPWIWRQRLFPPLVKQPFLRQPLLQLLVRHLKGAHAVRLHFFNINLKRAVLFIQGNPRPDNDLHPVFRTERQLGGIRPEHHRPDQRPLVLEGKIQVSGFVVIGEIGNLPADIHGGQVFIPLQQRFDITVQLADGNYGHSRPPFSRSAHKSAAPAALSAEKAGGANRPPKREDNSSRKNALDMTPPA